MTKIIGLLYLSKFTCFFIGIANCLDSFFPFDILEKHVFAQSSKHWFAYLRAFVHLYIKIAFSNTHLNNKTNHLSHKDKWLIEKLAFISKMSQVFLKKSKGIVIYFPPAGFDGHRNMAKYKCLINVERIQEGNHYCYPKFKPAKLKHWISTCILSSPTKNVLSETTESTPHFDISVGFVLDPFLQLNITFFALQLDKNRCVLNHVFVKQCLDNKALKCKNCPEHKQCQSFCGIHSMFYFIPKQQFVIISTKVVSSSHFTNLSYSIIDANKIHSIVVKEPIKLLDKHQLFQINTNCLGLLYVSIFKVYQLMLQIKIVTHESAVVFDGPGVLSPRSRPMLIGKREFYKMSTFQCVVRLFKHLTQSCAVDRTIQYTSHCANITQVTLNSNATLVMSYSSMKLGRRNHMSVFKYVSSSADRINITINFIRYKGQTSVSCGYSGITIYNASLDKPDKELETFCKGYSMSTRYRNIYSESHTVFLTLYSYIQYASLNISVSASVTHCKLFKVNPCAVLPKSMPYGRLFNRNFVGHETYRIQDKACVVVQVTPKYEGKEDRFSVYQSVFDRCFFSVKPHNSDTPGQTITFGIRGHFATFYNPPMTKIVQIYPKFLGGSKFLFCAFLSNFFI